MTTRVTLFTRDDHRLEADGQLLSDNSPVFRDLIPHDDVIDMTEFSGTVVNDVLYSLTNTPARITKTKFQEFYKITIDFKIERLQLECESLYRGWCRRLTNNSLREAILLGDLAAHQVQKTWRHRHTRRDESR